MTDTRKTFSHQLEELQQAMLEMGAMSEELIKNSVKALLDNDAALAEEVILKDDDVDKMELEIEEECMRLLALQQPMARDLRTISGVLKIITDIERLTDHSTKISKKVIKLSKLPRLKPYVDLPRMAERVIEMFKLSLDAFVRKDEELARKVIEMDDEIDEYNHKIFGDLVEYMVKDPECIGCVSHLMVVVQSLERIGDHVTNICERIIYVSTGVLPKSQ